MVIWGAVWGAIFGALLSRYDEAFGFVLGGVLGGLCGWTLRRSVDRRVARQLEERGAERRSDVDAASVSARATPGVPSPVPTAAMSAPTSPPTASPAELGDLAFDLPVTSSGSAAPPAATAPVPMAIRRPQAGVAASRPRVAAPLPTARDNDLVERAKAWLLGGNTVARLGAVVLFIGLAFLARLAAEYGLLPPELRLIGIGAAAVVLLALGFRLRERRPGYALTLQGAGVATLYLTIFAAFRLYDLLPPVLAFALMVAVCVLAALLAVLQDSRALAVMGTAGGFVAPILASTGKGDYVALFSYYALLNTGILAVAWKKDWRLLNLLGFVFTFGIGTLWGVLRFQPENYAGAQSFLIVFALQYVAIAVLFAGRRAPQLTHYVDGTLVFGVPLVGFGLQAGLVRSWEFGLAWSAVALAAFYLLLAGLLAQRRLQQLRLLIESFAALGLIFASLAIPLAVDARWTAAAWAIEGAALVWLGTRQQRRLMRAFGLLLQAGAAVAFVHHLSHRALQDWPLLNADFMGAALLAATAVFTSRCLALFHHSRSSAAGGYDDLEHALRIPLFLYGFTWWMLALGLELSRRVPWSVEGGMYAIDPQRWPLLLMLGFVLSAAVAAWQGVRRQWSVATWPAYANLPVLLLAALVTIQISGDALANGGLWIWPLAIAAHIAALRLIDTRGPRSWFQAVHAGGVLLLTLLGWSAMELLLRTAGLRNTGWSAAGQLAVLPLALVLIANAASSLRMQQHWPMRVYARAYAWHGLLPIAALAALVAVLLVLSHNGAATPLPYVPLLNPIELVFLLALSALWQWRSRLVTADWSLPAWLRDQRVVLSIVGLALFLWLNTAWLRIAHHMLGVRWTSQALFDSFVVQTGYALLWTLSAMGLMVFASRRRVRLPWIAGAVLLGLTVIKLVLIDLSNAGGLERVIAFIGVGVLMLLVGYLAPLPPAKSKPETA